MTVRFEGKIDSAAMNRVRRAIATTPSRVYPKLEQEFKVWGRAWEDAMVRRFQGETGKQNLRSRTGALRNSLSAKVTGGSISSLHLRCVSQGPNYARAQEYGANIKPVNKKWLTIPLSGEGFANRQGASGAPKYGTVAALVSAFGESRVFFLNRKGKDPLIAVRDLKATPGKKGVRLNRNAPGEITPMFVLKKSVTLPGPSSTGAKSRLGFFDEWAKLGRDRRAGLDRLGRSLGRAI